MNVTEKIKAIKAHLWALIQKGQMREEDYHDFATAIAENIMRHHPTTCDRIITDPNTDWKMLMDTQLDHILMDMALETTGETM